MPVKERCFTINKKRIFFNIIWILLFIYAVYNYYHPSVKIIKDILFPPKTPIAKLEKKLMPAIMESMKVEAKYSYSKEYIETIDRRIELREKIYRLDPESQRYFMNLIMLYKLKWCAINLMQKKKQGRRYKFGFDKQEKEYFKFYENILLKNLPKYPKLYMYLIGLYSNIDDYDKTISLCQEAIKKLPQKKELLLKGIEEYRRRKAMYQAYKEVPGR